MVNTQTRQLLGRAFFFLILVTVITFIINSWATQSTLFFRFGLWIYELVFVFVLSLISTICFIFRRHFKKLKVYPKNKVDSLLLSLVPLWMIIFYLSFTKLLTNDNVPWPWIYGTHFSIFIMYFLTFLGNMGVRTVISIAKSAQKFVK